MTSNAKRLGWVAGCAATLVLLPLLAGCLFDTREPEPPQTAAINYLPRSSAGNVWENCRLALVNKDSGGWDTAISEQFVYVPDGDTESSFSAVSWESWGKEQELNFVGNWFVSDVTIEANLLDTEINTPDGSGGIAEWDIIYFVTVIDKQAPASHASRKNEELLGLPSPRLRHDASMHCRKDDRPGSQGSTLSQTYRPGSRTGFASSRRQPFHQ